MTSSLGTVDVAHPLDVSAVTGRVTGLLIGGQHEHGEALFEQRCLLGVPEACWCWCTLVCCFSNPNEKSSLRLLDQPRAASSPSLSPTVPLPIYACLSLLTFDSVLSGQHLFIVVDSANPWALSVSTQLGTQHPRPRPRQVSRPPLPWPPPPCRLLPAKHNPPASTEPPPQASGYLM